MKGLTREEQRKVIMFAITTTIILVMVLVAAIVWANKYDEVVENNEQLNSQITSLQLELGSKNSEILELQHQLDESKK